MATVHFLPRIERDRSIGAAALATPASKSIAVKIPSTIGFMAVPEHTTVAR